MEVTDWYSLSELIESLWNENLGEELNGSIEMAFNETPIEEEYTDDSNILQTRLNYLSYTLIEPEVTYCENANACNTGSEGSCRSTSNRVDCNDNPLYCTDPVACNYDGSNGSCVYHGSRRL